RASLSRSFRSASRYASPRLAIRHFEAVFGIAPEFGAPTSVVARLLDIPMPQSSDLTANMCVTQCRKLLDCHHAHRGITGQVRDELLRDARRMPTQEEVAARLHVSVRTLRRQLADENTSYRALVEQTREGLAEELLGTGRLTVEQ